MNAALCSLGQAVPPYILKKRRTPTGMSPRLPTVEPSEQQLQQTKNTSQTAEWPARGFRKLVSKTFQSCQFKKKQHHSRLSLAQPALLQLLKPLCLICRVGPGFFSVTVIVTRREAFRKLGPKRVFSVLYKFAQGG